VDTLGVVGDVVVGEHDVLLADTAPDNANGSGQRKIRQMFFMIGNRPELTDDVLDEQSRAQ
jgi:hypothetical protein